MVGGWMMDGEWRMGCDVYALTKMEKELFDCPGGKAASSWDLDSGT